MGVHVVVGASGGTGTALVHELVRRGHEVRAVDRRGRAPVARELPGVRALAGDATDAARMRAVCAGADAVYNCVNPPFDRWREIFPAAIEGTIAGAAAAGARLVFADDTWMYGRVDAPMTEQTPVRPAGEKGVLRAWLAEIVLHADASGRCATVVGRAGELYGPLVESVLGDGLFGAALRARGRRRLAVPLRWVGSLDRPITPTYVGDFARVLATLGEAPDVTGRVWHVPHPPATTGRDLVAEIQRQAGSRAPVATLRSGLARRLGLVWPLAREGAQLVYQFEMPFVVDGSAHAARVPFTPTPYADGIARTLAWYRTREAAPDAAAPTGADAARIAVLEDRTPVAGRAR